MVKPLPVSPHGNNMTTDEEKNSLCFGSVIDRQPTGGGARGWTGRFSISWEEVFFGERVEEERRNRAVGGRRRHQLLDRRANDRRYMQTPPAAGRRLFPPHHTLCFLSHCGQILSLVFHYFQKFCCSDAHLSWEKKKFHSLWMPSIWSHEQTLSQTDVLSVVNAVKTVGGLKGPGDKWSGDRWTGGHDASVSMLEAEPKQLDFKPTRFRQG